MGLDDKELSWLIIEMCERERIECPKAVVEEAQRENRSSKH